MPCELAVPTQTRPSRFYQRATGPPRNLTFADTVEKVMDVDSGHSQVTTTDTHGIPAERLHPKAANWRCRPISDTHGLELAALKPPVKQIDAAEVRPS